MRCKYKTKNAGTAPKHAKFLDRIDYNLVWIWFGCCVSVVARSAKVLDRIDYNFVWIWFGCCVSVVACVVARCCVCVMHDSIISEQPGVVLAVHQDDFSGLTCISYRLSLGCTLNWGVGRPRPTR